MILCANPQAGYLCCALALARRLAGPFKDERRQRLDPLSPAHPPAPAYHGRCGGSTALPETERAAKEILSLPLYPELTEAQQFAVVRAVDEFKPE